jgi:hypothetical protein
MGMIWETSIPDLEGHLCDGDRRQVGMEGEVYPVGSAVCAGACVLPCGAGAGWGAVPVAGGELCGDGMGGGGADVGAGFFAKFDTEGEIDGGGN